MINWEEVLKDASWFHWTGITPAISQGAADACLEAIQAANKLGVPVSCDLNYRKNLWKYGKKASEVMPELVAGCDVILGNEEDAEKVFGIKPEGFDVAQTEGHGLRLLFPGSRYPGGRLRKRCGRFRHHIYVNP